MAISFFILSLFGFVVHFTVVTRLSSIYVCIWQTNIKLAVVWLYQCSHKQNVRYKTVSLKRQSQSHKNSKQNFKTKSIKLATIL